MASTSDRLEAVKLLQGGSQDWREEIERSAAFVPMITSFEASAFEAEAARYLNEQLQVKNLAFYWANTFRGQHSLHTPADNFSDYEALARTAIDNEKPVLLKHDEQTFRFAFPQRYEDCVAAIVGEIPGEHIGRKHLRANAATVLRQVTAIGARHCQLEVLKQHIEQQTKTEKIQRALYAIADMASSDLEMPDMLSGLHQIVAELMYAENLFIALHHVDRKTLHFIYHSDNVDTSYTDTQNEIPESDLENSLTLALIKGGKPLMGPSVELRGLFDIPYDPAFGPNATDWLGVPMVADNAVRGAIVVQSYSKDRRYTDQDRDLLSFVGQHILTALDRKSAHERLEQNVAQRTQELEFTNQTLLQQVELRERGEQLQSALYRIAALSTATLSLAEICAEIHHIVEELVTAPNLFIALISSNGKMLEFPYAADEHDHGTGHFKSRKIGKGLTELVLRRGEPVLVAKQEMRAMAEAGEMQWFGTEPDSWMGAPLINDQSAVGVIAIQSYSPDVIYEQPDLDLLTFVSHHIAAALQRKNQSESLREAYQDLEQRVIERTQELGLANTELQDQVTRLGNAERLQSALFAIADMASANLDMPEMLSRVHSRVGELMYAKNFGIVLNDDEAGTIRFLYFADAEDNAGPQLDVDIPKAEIPNSLVLALIKHGESLMGPSDDLCERFGINQQGQHGPKALDWLGVPMLAGEQVRGAIMVQTYGTAHQFSEEDRDLLQFVAHHILTAVERKQAHVELERRVEERTVALEEANQILMGEVKRRQRGERLQSSLFRIAELAGAQLPLDSFYSELHRIVGGLLSARNFFIALVSEDGKEIHFPYAADEHGSGGYTNRPLSNGLTEYVIRERKALRATRAQIDVLMSSGEVSSIGSKSLSWLGVPLTDENRVLGVIAVQSYSPDVVYSKRHQEVLTFVSFHIATALRRRRQAESLKRAYAELENRVSERTQELAQANAELRDQIAVRQQIEERLQYDALHDSLTDLPNRTLLLDRLTHTLELYRRDSRHDFAVLFLDLDRFKVVNDSVGHLVGDELLKEAGERIAGCLRTADTVARLGGDEFAILLEELEEPNYATQVAERIIRSMDKPFKIAGKELFSSVSVGIAMAHRRYNSAEELLRDADVAMYRAKAKGRHRFELFDEGLHDEALKLLDLENDLRRAITRREFEPHYQTIVNLEDGTVVGYEALLRWHHPERGLLLPRDFLGVAEDTGHVDDIDWLIFEQVFAEAGSLLDQGRFVSINVSARHFHGDDLDRRLFDLFEKNQLSPEAVRIEVTEGALLENPEHIRSMLTRLREKGVRTHIDDFGTGYSSLSYLHRFPLHGVKIDREFVADLTLDGDSSSGPIVRAIRALAGSLNMEVIAEGIENDDQRHALCALGCKTGQGFFFAKPLPRHQIH